MGIWGLINELRSACWSAVARVNSEYVRDEGRRTRITRMATSFARRAAYKSFRVGLKLVPGGIQVHKIVKERLKAPRLPLNSNENKKPELTAGMEEMQARMEKMQEEVNTIKQQSKISMASAKGSESLKEFPDEPIKGSAPLKTDPKRVFIRSRL